MGLMYNYAGVTTFKRRSWQGLLRPAEIEMAHDIAYNAVG
jgi:hypothetical protein